MDKSTNYSLDVLEQSVEHIFDDSVPADLPSLDCWLACENPNCFERGCPKALNLSVKGVRHV